MKKAAAECAAAVFSNLALERRDVNRGEYFQLYSSAYTIIKSILDGSPVTGTVPLPLFQIFASLKSRVVDLGGQTQFSVHFDLATVTHTGLPDVAAGGDASYFCQKASALGGVLVDLKDLNVSSVGPFPEHGYPIAISIGASLGVANVTNNLNDRYGILEIRQSRPVTEMWMSHLTWATQWDIEAQICERFVCFPQSVDGGSITPGSVILTTALRVADVIGTTTFDFPAVDLACVQAFLTTNARARKSDVSDDIRFDLKAALAITAGTGLRAGQVAFFRPFFEKSNFQLPQDIVEANLLLPTFREGNARIPYVMTLNFTNPNSYKNNYADGTENGIQFALAAVTAEGDRVIGLSDAEMSYDDSAFLNNTYDRQTVNAALTYTGVRPAYGGTSTVTAAEPAATDWNNIFSQTISKGPLARPSGDKVMTTLNFTDLSCDRFSVKDVPSGLTVAGYLNINCFAAGMQGPNIAILASLPLPLEAVVLNELPSDKFQTTPLVQNQQRIALPAVVAVSHTVTEASAKYTELQQFFENMQSHGYGGAGLFGDIKKLSGQAIYRMRRQRALGFLVTGKVFNASLNGLRGEGRSRKVRPRSKRVNPSGVTVQGRPVGGAQSRKGKAGNTPVGSVRNKMRTLRLGPVNLGM